MILRLPCVFTRSPTMVGRGSWPRSTVRMALATRGVRATGGCACGVTSFSAATMARMWSGVLPQHPPTTFGPKSRTMAAICLAISSGPRS